MQHKQLNLSKKHEFYGTLTCSIPIPQQLLNSLENKHTKIKVKINRFAVTGEGKMKLELPNSSILRELSLFDLFVLFPWKIPLARVSLFDLTLSSSNINSLWPRVVKNK